MVTGRVSNGGRANRVTIRKSSEAHSSQLPNELAGTRDPKSWSRIITLAIAAAIVASVSTFAFGPPHYTIESTYTDHVGKEYNAWAFTQVGFRVFAEPVDSWSDEVRAAHPHPLWETSPHPYPMGSILLFLPFGVLANLGWLSDLAVHWAMSTLLALASLWACFVFWQGLAFYARSLRMVVVGLVGIAYVHWGFNGFFDALIAGLAVLAITNAAEERHDRATLLFTFALSLQYRIWYLIPIAVLSAWRHYKAAGIDWRLGIAGFLGIPSIIAFLLTFSTKAFALSTAEGFHGTPATTMASGEIMPLIALLGGVILLVVVMMSGQSMPTKLAIALAVATTALLPIWGGWYGILLTPALALASTERLQVALVLAYVQTLFVLGAFPNLPRVASLWWEGLTS